MSGVCRTRRGDDETSLFNPEYNNPREPSSYYVCFFIKSDPSNIQAMGNENMKVLSSNIPRVLANGRKVSNSQAQRIVTRLNFVQQNRVSINDQNRTNLPVHKVP